jgi:uncharacterized protein (DUF427 family)
MALTIGTGPFGDEPAGHFDVAPPRMPLLFWEPFPKRFRVRHGGEIVADSRGCLALHQTGQMMRLCVPRADVRSEFLVQGPALEEKQVGRVRSWSIDTGKGMLDAAARSFEAPPNVAAALLDHTVFDLDKVDHWYLDDDLGYAHPRDPYHRFDVQRAAQHVVVSAGGTLVAETWAPAILYETSIALRIYLPPDAIRVALVKSDTVSRCPYKGDGQHWHVDVNGRRIANAAWNLTTPMGDALMIPRWFSFYAEKLDILVDGRKLGA